jgi:uncharacterized protein DUF4154
MALLKAAILAAVLPFAGGRGGTWPVQTQQTPEYRVKAVFLFNFAQFVEWPPGAFPDSQAPVVIGVLGEDPFGSLLEETVRGEALGGRPFQVRRYHTVDEIKACQILFISRSESDRLQEILAGLKGRPILTVGDGEGFSVRGGMVRFVMDKNRIRLRINLEAAQAANLTISSKLLRSAEIVTSKTP